MDPLQITTLLSAATGIVEKISILHPPPFPDFLRIEKQILMSPFPPGITIPESEHPVRSTFLYPVTEAATVRIYAVTTYDDSQLKLLEYRGSVTREDCTSTFQLIELNPPDGNLLTGMVKMEETTSCSGDKRESKTDISIVASLTPRFSPIYIQINTTFNSGRESLTKLFLNPDYPYEVTGLIRWNNFTEGVVINETSSWEGDRLQQMERTTQGKDFLWIETVTASTNDWSWKINNGKTAYGILTGERGNIYFPDEKWETCFNAAGEVCSVEIRYTSGTMYIISGDISARGTAIIKPFNSQLSLTYEDGNGSFNGTLSAEEDIHSIFTLTYKRDLTFTDIAPDEYGTGTIYSFLTFSLLWTKRWYRGETSYTSFYHFPHGSVRTIMEN